MVLVKVKHGKATYEVELDQSKDVQSFKALLQGVTNVPPERQSLMGKGLWIGTLKDDKDLSTLKVKPGQLLTLMGSADVLKEVPKNVSVCEGVSFQSQSCLAIPNLYFMFTFDIY